MNTKTYYQLVAVIFSIIAVLHAVRGIYQWEAVVAGVAIPVWVSWVAVLIAGYLAVRGFQFAKHRRKG